MRIAGTLCCLAVLLFLLGAGMPGAAWAEFEDDSCIKSVEPMELNLPYTAGVASLEVKTYDSSCSYTVTNGEYWLDLVVNSR